MKSKNPLSEIPYRTLEMIEEANGEEVLLLALFKGLDSVKSNSLDVALWQMVIAVKNKLYVKDEDHDIIFVYDTTTLKNSNDNQGYIFLFKDKVYCSSNQLLEEIKKILVLFKRDFKEVSIDKFRVELYEEMIMMGAIETCFGVNEN